MPISSHKTTYKQGIFAGLMSGTSLDAIDAALVSITPDQPPHLIAHHSHTIPETLRQQILALCQPGPDEITQLIQLDRELGQLFGDALNVLIERSGLPRETIIAAGCHGQTIRHLPGYNGASLQLGNADDISERTGLAVVHNFRNRDIVLGGQGAPLVPRYHQVLFAERGVRKVIVNIGGMANVTLLDGNVIACGFDTGPGNVLLNSWHQRHHGTPFDKNGAWARQGTCIDPLLQHMLSESYFNLPAPKSTGRERFNDQWLMQHLQHQPPGTHSADVQHTLTQLTAQTIADAVNLMDADEVLVCGGGVHNGFLMEKLQQKIQAPTCSTEQKGVDPDWIEACAFAWLAWARLNQVAGNAPIVTGAQKAVPLGSITFP